MSNAATSQSTFIKPFDILTNVNANSTNLSSQHLQSSKHIKNFQPSGIFVKDFYTTNKLFKDVALANICKFHENDNIKQPCSTVLTMKGKIPDKLENLHSKLYAEAEKIQKWKISKEVEHQQSGKKLHDAYQTIDSQRKVVLDLQLQNESLGMQLSEELQNRKEILQKIQSTRELCFALKSHFDGLQESINFCYGTKETLEIMNEQRQNVYKDLEEKFAILKLSHDEKVSMLNNVLISKEQETNELQISYNGELMDSQTQVETLNQLLESKENEISRLSVELKESKTDCDNLMITKQQHLSQISDFHEISKQQVMEITNIREHLKKTQDEKEALESTIALFKESVVKLETMNGELKSLLQECKQDYEENINSLKNCLDKTTQELNFEKERSEEISTENVKYKSQLEEMVKNQDDLEQQIKEISHDNKMKDQLKEEIVHLNERINSLLQEKEDLDNDLRRLSSDKEGVNNDLMKILAENEHLNKSLMKITSEKDIAEKNLEMLILEKSKELENFSMESKVKLLGAESEKKCVEESYLNLLNEMQKLEDQRERKNQELCDLKNYVKKLDQLLSSKEEAYKEIELQYCKLNSELVEEQDHHKNASGKWEEAKEELEILKDDITTKDSEIMLLQSKIILLENKMSDILKEKADEKEQHVIQMRDVTQLLDKVQKDYCKDMVAKQNEIQDQQNQIDKLQDQLRFRSYEKLEIEHLTAQNEELKSKIEKIESNEDNVIVKKLNVSRGIQRKQVTFKDTEEIETSASDSVEIEMAISHGIGNRLAELKMPPVKLSSQKPRDFPAARIAPSRRMTSKLRDEQENNDFKIDTTLRKRENLDVVLDELSPYSRNKKTVKLKDTTNSNTHSVNKSTSSRKFFKTSRNSSEKKSDGKNMGLSWFEFDSTYGLIS